jgi:hypothetical protein
MDLVVMGFEMYLIEPLADACGLESIKTSPPPESALRQFVVAWSVLTIGAYLFYFFFSGLNYYIIHLKFGNLKHAPFHGQVCAEIMMASKGILVSLWFLCGFFVISFGFFRKIILNRFSYIVLLSFSNLLFAPLAHKYCLTLIYVSNSNYGFINSTHCSIRMPRLF